jgi:hypothetical protein
VYDVVGHGVIETVAVPAGVCDALRDSVIETVALAIAVAVGF